MSKKDFRKDFQKHFTKTTDQAPSKKTDDKDNSSKDDNDTLKISKKLSDDVDELLNDMRKIEIQAAIYSQPVPKDKPTPPNAHNTKSKNNIK